MINPFTELVGPRRIRPLVAWRAWKVLQTDPEATGEVFKMINALQGVGSNRVFNRMKITLDGEAMIAEKPDLVAALSDRDTLRAMPDGSLGRRYLKFMEDEGLAPGMLLDASDEAPTRGQGQSDEERWLGNRLRDMHDIYHVMTGYGRDPLGELCVLSFSNQQTRSRGIAFLIKMAEYGEGKLTPNRDMHAAIMEGRSHSKSAAWFPEIRWEEKLNQPLDKLREEFGVVPPKTYEAIKRTWAEAAQGASLPEAA